MCQNFQNINYSLKVSLVFVWNIHYVNKNCFRILLKSYVKMIRISCGPGTLLSTVAWNFAFYNNNAKTFCIDMSMPVTFKLVYLLDSMDTSVYLILSDLVSNVHIWNCYVYCTHHMRLFFTRMMPKWFPPQRQLLTNNSQNN